MTNKMSERHDRQVPKRKMGNGDRIVIQLDESLSVGLADIMSRWNFESHNLMRSIKSLLDGPDDVGMVFALVRQVLRNVAKDFG